MIILLVVGMRFSSISRISNIFWFIGYCFGGRLCVVILRSVFIMQLCVVTLWCGFCHRKGSVGGKLCGNIWGR